VIRLEKSLDAWGTPALKSVLKQELEQSGVEQLPLVEGMTHGSVPLDDTVEVMVQSVSETDEAICAKVGIFYKSVIAGCACADDPTPTDEVNEYCEVRLEIDKTTAEATIVLLS